MSSDNALKAFPSLDLGPKYILNRLATLAVVGLSGKRYF
jgi:hypothetical protein